MPTVWGQIRCFTLMATVLVITVIMVRMFVTVLTNRLSLMTGTSVISDVAITRM